jgi:hypothetical protein
MLAHAMEGYKNDGKLDVAELDQILEQVMSDDTLDPRERKALMNILFNLTSTDLTPELWFRVEQLIQRFGLDK